MADGLIPSVLSYLNSAVQSELGSVLSCRQELQDLSSAFKAIQAVLRDAERRQRKEEALSDWLEKIKDVAYDVEDLLDECRAESIRYENEESRISPFAKRVCNSVLRTLSVDETVKELGFHVKLGIEMGRRLKIVRERLQMICSEKTNFHLEESIASRIETAERKTSSLIDESEIIGRTSDKERIIPWLVSDSSRVSNEIPVISIIGLGGVGKTALAQLIYNDDRVTQHFSKRMWVHVSDDFNVTRICKAIIEAAEGCPAPGYSEWEMVQNHLWNVLKGEQFLLVLDDMWNENQEMWDQLRLPLKGGVSGSRIMITTRNETVLKTMGAKKWHGLAPLLESDSWSLFSHIAFREKNTEERAELEEIGKEIARKCDRVPLIIKRIANALRLKRTRREWELLLDSETWDFPNVTKGIVVDLQLSYENMPPFLKCCFAFCFMFPKDHVIERETLIKLWMAQGFIHPEESSEMENTGDEYFYNLLGRSLFDAPIIDCFGNVMHCKVMDIVHDFFQTVMRECYIMNTDLPNNIPMHVRHVSLKCNGDLSSIPQSLFKAKNLRTLLVVGWSKISEMPDDFLENFRFLRALDLSGTKCYQLPESLKNLKLLRYLNLSTTPLSVLPEFICGLYLLQTLKLNECYPLFKLPKELWKLARLRHLEIKGTCSLWVLPHGIGRLTSLRTLSKFIVSEGMQCRIGELKNLNLLRGELAIYLLNRVLTEDEAKEAELMNKKYLRLLELYFEEEDIGDSFRKPYQVKRIEIDGVLEGLRPHTNLEELKISDYSGLKFPGWMENASFSKLVNVTLRECHYCEKLPALGTLPSLKYLTIIEMNRLMSIGPEFYGGNNDSPDVTGAAVAFPTLETLVLEGMYRLMEWVGREDGGMPSLLELRIANCPMLRKVPLFLHGKLWKVDIDLPSKYWTSCAPESVECLVVNAVKIEGISMDITDIQAYYRRKGIDMPIKDTNAFHPPFSRNAFHPPFSRNLKYLVIRNAQDCEFPFRIQELCGLQMLHIRDCRRLTHLPKELRYLRNLRELKITSSPNLEKWCQKYADDDQQQAMSHIPNIWIGDQEIKRDGRDVAREARRRREEGFGAWIYMLKRDILRNDLYLCSKERKRERERESQLDRCTKQMDSGNVSKFCGSDHKVFDKHRGAYSSSRHSAVCPFYWDVNGYQEVAMGKANYLQSFKQNADSFICSLLPGTSRPQIQYSPGGLIFKAGGSNMQHVTSLSFLLLAYSNYISHSRQLVPCGKISATPAQLRQLAKRQVDYILGDNPKKMSYMVGYGNHYPLRIHHRASSLPSVASHPAQIGCKAGSRYYLTPNPNPNILVGAVVGGPNITDDFPDSRPFFQESEPTTYINAPLVGLLGYFWAHPNPT